MSIMSTTLPTRLAAALSGFALAVSLPVAALAAEMQGTVVQIDPDNRVIVMDTGESFTVAEGVDLEQVAPGTTVVVTVADGTTDATDVVVAQ